MSIAEEAYAGYNRYSPESYLYSVLAIAGVKDKYRKEAGAALMSYGTEAVRKMEPLQLQGIPGIGPIGARKVWLANRIAYTDNGDLVTRIQSSSDSAQHLAFMRDYEVEKFVALFLNRNNDALATKELFSGGVSSTVIDPKVVFKEAVLRGASGIIVAHNHPSGNLKPSSADLRITGKLYKAGKVLDIRLLDHLIISSRGYYSFADEGMIKD